MAARTYPTTVTANSVTSSAKFNDEIVLQLQHLLGFTLDGDNLDSIATPKEIHRFKGRVAPPTPTSGNMEMYVDSADGVLKTKDDTGIARIGAGGWHNVALNNGQYDITLSDYEDFVGAAAIEFDVGFRSLASGTSDVVRVYFESDTTNINYHKQTGGGQNNAAIAGYGNSPDIMWCPAAGSPANEFAVGKIYIEALDKTMVRKARFVGGMRLETALLRTENTTVSWTNTTVLSWIRIRPDGWSADKFSTSSWLKMKFIK